MYLSVDASSEWDVDRHKILQQNQTVHKEHSKITCKVNGKR